MSKNNLHKSGSKEHGDPFHVDTPGEVMHRRLDCSLIVPPRNKNRNQPASAGQVSMNAFRANVWLALALCIIFSFSTVPSAQAGMLGRVRVATRLTISPLDPLVVGPCPPSSFI